jgi:hypothetical protein
MHATGALTTWGVCVISAWGTRYIRYYTYYHLLEALLSREGLSTPVSSSKRELARAAREVYREIALKRKHLYRSLSREVERDERRETRDETIVTF